MSKGQVVLITGCSTGFGRGSAEALARKGHTVFASMRDCSGKNAAHKEALEHMAKQENLALSVEELDVTSDESVETAVQRILAVCPAFIKLRSFNISAVRKIRRGWPSMGKELTIPIARKTFLIVRMPQMKLRE